MKIMFYYYSINNIGGAERVISYLANNFVERGDEISIMVTDHLPPRYPLDKRVKLINLNAESASTGLGDAVKNNLQRARITRKYLRKLSPDVVVCFGISGLTAAYLAKPFLGIKIIGSERNNPKYIDDGIWKYLKKWVSPLAHGFIFQTDKARMHYPQSVQKKSVVISNGIYIDDTNIGVLSLNQRIPDSICAVGRLNEQKGFDTLIHAFSKFVVTRPSYTLTIYGEGSERSNLEALISLLGLNEKVNLVGKIDNVLEEISRRQIFVLSSRYEGMPNALIEAMACGCACISTDCDYGPSELIKEGEDGLLVAVGDAGAMAGAMERIAEDPVFAEKLAQNAKKIRDTNSLNKIADSYYEYIMATARQ